MAFDPDRVGLIRKSYNRVEHHALHHFRYISPCFRFELFDRVEIPTFDAVSIEVAPVEIAVAIHETKIEKNITIARVICRDGDQTIILRQPEVIGR